MVIGHTDCGVRHIDSEQMIQHMKARGISQESIDLMKYCGIDFERWLAGFDTVEQSVTDTVDTIRNHPSCPRTCASAATSSTPRPGPSPPYVRRDGLPGRPAGPGDQAARWFSAHWGGAGGGIPGQHPGQPGPGPGVPQWYVTLSPPPGEIVAGWGSSPGFPRPAGPHPQPLRPLLWRRPGGARAWPRALLDLARQEARAAGIPPGCTWSPTTAFYEKCGWTYLTQARDTETGNPSACTPPPRRGAVGYGVPFGWSGLLRCLGARAAPGARLPGRGPHFSRKWGERGPGALPPGPPFFYGPLVATRWFWRGGAQCSGRGAVSVPICVP